MSIRKLVKFIIFLAVFAMAIRISIDTDTWWHLKTGEYILQNLEIPQTDIFSHTRFGDSWRGASSGWLMESLLFLMFSKFGYGGLNILTAVMVTIAFFIIYKTMSGGVFLRGFIIILVATVSSVFWAARPYLMSFVLSACTLLILEDYRWERKDRLWLLPIIMIIWGNSHAGFAYGLIFWGLYGIAEGVIWIGQADKFNNGLPNIFNFAWLIKGFKGRVGKLLLIGLLMFLAICINPAGPQMLLYPYETVSITALHEFIQEWQSPNFQSLQVQPFAWLVILMLAVLGISKKRLVLSDILLFGTFTCMGLIAGRNIAIFALVAAPILSRYAAPIMKIWGKKINYFGLSNEKSIKPFNYLNWVILFSIVSIVVLKTVLVLPEEVNHTHINSLVPSKAIQFLKENPQQGNMLNTYNWGGYIIWELPDYPVFIDGRTDLYGDEIIYEWIDIITANDGWEEKLEKWNINLVIIEPNMQLASELDYANWTLLYEDEMAIIYRR